MPPPDGLHGCIGTDDKGSVLSLFKHDVISDPVPGQRDVGGSLYSHTNSMARSLVRIHGSFMEASVPELASTLAHPAEPNP